jgi:hypothetical protein
LGRTIEVRSIGWGEHGMTGQWLIVLHKSRSSSSKSGNTQNLMEELMGIKKEG